MEHIHILLNSSNYFFQDTFCTAIKKKHKVILHNNILTQKEMQQFAQKYKQITVLTDNSLISNDAFDVKKDYPAIKFILYSNHIQPFIIKKYFKLGCNAYVSMSEISFDEMIQCISIVNDGGLYLSNTVKEKIINSVIYDDNNPNNQISLLTARELQIIQNICSGQTSKEIALALNISMKTVEVHRHNILKKLKLSNSNALVKFALTYLDNKSMPLN